MVLALDEWVACEEHAPVEVLRVALDHVSVLHQVRHALLLAVGLEPLLWIILPEGLSLGGTLGGHLCGGLVVVRDQSRFGGATEFLEAEVPRNLIQHPLEVQGLIVGGGPGAVEFLARLLLDGLELLLGSPVSCEFAIILRVGHRRHQGAEIHLVELRLRVGDGKLGQCFLLLSQEK